MNRFKAARLNVGMQQKVAASELGVSVQSLAYWESETEKRTPSKKNLLKLAEMYGVTTDYLLGKDDDCEPVIETNPETKKEPASIDELPGLTDAQRQLLKAFNRCKAEGRARVLAYAEGAADNP